jgi:hypothetical protein
VARIFLSYAKEDQALGRRLAAALLDHDFQVYWWQDPARQGQRFMNKIEDEVYAADRFVALLSPAYLRSFWCRIERNMAISLVSGGRTNFITVFEAAPLHADWPGLLIDYARIPLRNDNDWTTNIKSFANAAACSVKATAAAAQPASRPKPKFRNRTDELNLIVDRLTSVGGEMVCLVSAPPQLGKSWFDDELAYRVTQRWQDCKVEILDLHDQPIAMRSDPLLLFRTLLALSTPLPNQVTELTAQHREAIAREVSTRCYSQLYILDSADLLEAGAPQGLCELLSELFTTLTDRATKTNVRVVIGGRRVDQWYLPTDVRSRKLQLTGFTEDIVHDALVDLASKHLELSRRELVLPARRVHRFSEGLPALLVKVLERIGEDHFFGIDRDEWWERAFDEVVRPYVDKELLSTDSLFLRDGEELNQDRALIEQALKVLSPYRMVTMGNVKFHADRDPSLQTALQEASWSHEQLFKGLTETALVTLVPTHPWYEIYPPIRRLLYRYYLADGNERAVVHGLAQQYYQWAEKPSGTERLVMLVEYIWHEVMRRTAGGDHGLDSLPTFAAEATEEFVRHSMYSTFEVNGFVIRQLEGDDEMKLALSGQPGLFNELRASILSAIEAVDR